jgi:hypothetical protein
MFIRYDSRKLKVYILKKDNTSTNDDFFFLLYSSVYKQHSDETNWKCLLTRFHHSHLLPSKVREKERLRKVSVCLFFKYRRRKNLKQNITHQFWSQSMLLFVITESSIYTVYENEWLWSNKWFSSCFFFNHLHSLGIIFHSHS